MAEIWEDLGKELLGMLKTETKDLWEEEDTDFLKTCAYDMAKQKVLASMAATEGEKQVHITNLENLSATIEGEIIRKKIKLNTKGKELLPKILTVVAKTLISMAIAAIQEERKGNKKFFYNLYCKFFV